LTHLGSHTYGNFQQLALAVDKPVKFVKKDIKRMIKKGWFLQGHVDKQETCLITSNETYEQYVSTQKQLEERQQKETLLRQQADESARRENECRQQAEERMRQEEKENLSPEVRQVLDKGNDFLEKIRRSNDAIPGEEISRKTFTHGADRGENLREGEGTSGDHHGPEPPDGLLSSHDCEASECL